MKFGLYLATYPLHYKAAATPGAISATSERASRRAADREA